MTLAVEETAIGHAEVKPRLVKKPYERLRAPFSLRCGALLIDYIILVAILAFSTLIARMLGGGARTAGTSSETAGILITITVAVLNLGVLAGYTGFTLGKWATGLRIERTDQQQLGIGKALLRHFVGYPLSFLVLGLGFVMAALNSRGRTLHDLIAGTFVVRDMPNPPRRLSARHQR
jgi:uncharacterized RDD family membrane protein YckC